MIRCEGECAYADVTNPSFYAAYIGPSKHAPKDVNWDRTYNFSPRISNRFRSADIECLQNGLDEEEYMEGPEDLGTRAE